MTAPDVDVAALIGYGLTLTAACDDLVADAVELGVGPRRGSRGPRPLLDVARPRDRRTARLHRPDPAGRTLTARPDTPARPRRRAGARRARGRSTLRAMPTDLLERAESGLADRGGSHLLAYRESGQIARLAKGSTLSTDVGILKAGSFHGGAVVLDGPDLEAIVARFDKLNPDVFVPPFRIDHGISATEVVGYFEAIRVVDLADPSDGGRVKPYLVGDVRWVDDAIVAELRKPATERRYRNRSSEIGAYETNGGEILPLVLWGCAFVDIPAVEGLDAAPIKLRQITPPAAVVALSEGSPAMPDAPIDSAAAPEVAPSGDVVVETAGDAAATGTSTGLEEVVDPSVADAEPVDSDGAAAPADAEGTPAVEGAAGADTPAVDVAVSVDASADTPAAPVTAEGATTLATEHRADVDLAAIRARVDSGELDTVEALRALGMTRQADDLAAAREADLTARIGRYAALSTPATETHLRTLLGHRDRAVVDGVEAILELAAARGPALDTPAGRAYLRPALGAGSPSDRVISLGMTPDEVGTAWAALSPAERVARQSEYDDWRLASSANRTS